MTQDANDVLMGGGIPSAKFEKPGAKVSGVIAYTPEVQQQRDIKDGKPLTWDDGKPKQQVKVILQTNSIGDDDNGERAIYLKGGMMKAVREAVKKAGAKGLEIGGKLAVQYTKDGEKTRAGFNAPKIYAALYKAPYPLEGAAASEPEEAAEAAEEGLDDF